MNPAGNLNNRCRTRYHLFVIVAIGLAGVLMITPAAATPPSAMSISFDSISHNLTVTISHATLNPRMHYIKEVKVTIDGQTANDFLYTSQPTSDTFTYVYPLTPKPGDIVEVTATCSLTGSATRTLTIPGESTGTAQGQAVSPPVTQKAATGLLPLAGILILMLTRKP